MTCEHVQLYGGMKIDELKKADLKKVISVNEEEETPRKPGSSGFGEALRSWISLNVASTFRTNQLSITPLDYATFTELDNKMKEE